MAYVEDRASIIAGQASALFLGGGITRVYVDNAMQSDLYGMEAAAVALDRSQREAVRNLAFDLRTDHARSRQALRNLAEAEAPNVQTAGGLDRRRRGLVSNLRSAHSREFDQVYLNQVVASLEKGVALHRAFAHHAGTPGLARYASRRAFRLRARLSQAEEIRTNLEQEQAYERSMRP